MSASFTSQPDSSVPLYLTAPVGNFQVGYWVTSPRSSWPSVPLSLSDSWTSVTGVYLFMNAAPSNLTGFAAAMAQLLAGGPYANARFLWIANPNDPLQSWQIQQLDATQPGGNVTATARITFNNFYVSIGLGSTVALTAGDDGFTITPTVSSFNVAGGASFALTGGTLPFTGSTCGCLSFSMAAGAAGQANFFSALGVAINYFVDDPDFAGTVDPLTFPLFSGQIPQQTLTAQFDPINPLLPLRTFLGFPTTNAQTLNSYFRTNIGGVVTLTPASSTFTPYAPSLVMELLQNSNPANAQSPYYFTPAGSFTIGPPGVGGSGSGFIPPATRLMCGAAGIEYLGLQAASGSLLHFWPGQNAYIPGLLPADVQNTMTLAERAAVRDVALGDAVEPLAPLALTSWVYCTPPQSSSVVYFAQPESSALYGAGTASFLDFLEVPAGTLSTSAQTPAFPMVPFAGVVASALDRYAQIETQVLSPARRDILTTLAVNAASNGANAVAGATPQGLLVELDTPRTAWNSVTLAQLTATGAQSLVLTNVTGGFQDALQTNQLFAVASDPAVFLANAGVQYEITATVLFDLTTKRDPLPQAVITQLQSIEGTVYATFSAFDTQLQTTLGTNYAAYHAVVEQYAAIFSITLDGWRFRLSPTLWKAVADFPTLVVFKYANAPVVDLAPDLGSWSWIEAAGSDPRVARDRLIAILDTARQIVAAANGVPNDLDDFVAMINDPSWNGILFLNANVPVTALPAELSALVAGIDANKFFAHHFAVQLTPISVTGGVPSLGNSSISALIAYDDPADLYYQGDFYDFKVLSLHALFRNSILVNFSSRIELMTNGYFGELCDLQNSTHNNNLILEGSALRQPGGTLSYVFLQQGSNVFAMRSNVLQSVEIVRVQFVTTIPPQGSTPTATTQAQFLLWGNLRWQQLPFDLFSFGQVLSEEAVPLQDGWLPFAGLSIDMEAQGTENGSKTLTFDPGAITLTPVSAVPRAQSLYAHFPLVLTSLIAGTAGKLPADLGYTALTIPGGSGALGPEWYGLRFDLDLGTLGALAGDLGFGISILAAWAPGGTVANVQAGMLLPGGQGLTSLIPIQSVISLGFSSAGFTSSEQDNGTMYMLAFRRFVLELLGVSFPPGQSDLVFFTNPNNSDRSTLGWYAAYSKD